MRFVRQSFFIILLASPSLFAWKMESGTLSLPATVVGSMTWQHVTFQQSYDAPPLIFAMPDKGSGYPGDSPAALRIDNVTASGFDIVQVEPQGSDGAHPAMPSVHYIAIEAGVHTLSDGTTIEAGTVDTSRYMGKNASGTKSWETVAFSHTFNATPIVLGMIQTLHNEQSTLPGESSAPWMVTAIKNVGTGGFKTALDMVKTDQGSPIQQTETIAYLAVDAGKSGSFRDSSGSCDRIGFQTLLSANHIRGWQNQCTNESFGNTYAADPNLFASMQTRNGGHGGWLRQCSISTTSVGLAVDEDTTNGERKHINEKGGILIFGGDFVYDSSYDTSTCVTDTIARYDLDECYWLGTGMFDLINKSADNDAESYNNAQPDKNDAKVCFSGAFGQQGYFQPESTITVGNEWSYALWIKFPLDSGNHDHFFISGTDYYYFALGSVAGTGDLPALLVERGGSDIAWELYDANGDDTVADLPDTLSGWHHFAFVQHNGTISLYLDGQYHNSIHAAISGDVEAFLTSLDNPDQQSVGSSTDEVLLWDYALSAQEISQLHRHQNNGNDIDGSVRICPTCESVLTANTWDLIGIPADLRSDPKTVSDIFSDDLGGTYGTDWYLYKRDYSDTNNSSWYTYLNATDTLEFGKGYWIFSKNDAQWSENGAAAVDYNATHGACTADRCVIVDLKSTSVDFDTDPDDGTGPYRYNMSGFPGHTPVNWSDCRILIDATAYTPKEAADLGYMSDQIWIYNPSASDANANGYTTCSDTTPGGCKLVPYKGFWLELHGSTKNKTVQLLIPQE